MPPVLKRSISHKWKEHRRTCSCVRVQLICLAIACSGVLVTVYELSRDGDLTLEIGREHHRIYQSHALNARNQPSRLLSENSSVHNRLRAEVVKVPTVDRVGRDSLSEGDVGIDIDRQRKSKEGNDLQQDPVFEDRGLEEAKYVGNGKESQDTLKLGTKSPDHNERYFQPKRPSFAQQIFDLLRAWTSIQSGAGKAIDVSGGQLEFNEIPTALTSLGNDGTMKEPTGQCQNGTSQLHSGSTFDTPRIIPKCWKPPKQCGTAEEMGIAAVGDTRTASLRVRGLIKTWMVDHGAQLVSRLPGEDFCKRGFVLGMASENGFGNNMYKVLTAAGLAVMLNRSLILGERGVNNPSYIGDSENVVLPFGDYLMYSNETFNMKEVKLLWALHDCAGRYKRPLTVHVDDIEGGPAQSKSLCDDWTTLSDSILWFKGTMDTVGLQILLKNANLAMRTAAAKLLGNPSVPSSRPNTFGELFRSLVTPSSDIQAAVQWALKGGPEPDIALHLRMRNNHSQEAPSAASACIIRNLKGVQHTSGRKPRVVVISDTPEVFQEIEQDLKDSSELIQFDYMGYLNEFKNLSKVMSLYYGQPPRNKVRDWGKMPRWVSLVDFFLAARARVAVVSAANERVCTTYVQLVGSLAAASTLAEGGEKGSGTPCIVLSSFQRALVAQGLIKQSGWGHGWRTFGGKLGCRDQAPQCARTSLLPYAWWDGPWQSPTTRDIRKMGSIGIKVDETGEILGRSLDEFCEAHQKTKPTVYKLKVPSCTEGMPCP